MIQRVNWAAIFAGQGFEAEPWAQREARRIQANEPHCRVFFDARTDESRWPVALPPDRPDGPSDQVKGVPYDSLAEQRRIVAEGWPGQVFGGGCRPCPQCRAEERGAGAVEKFDHSCWREDMRLEQRLRDAARIARGEAGGEVLIGTRVGPDNRIVPD